MYRLRYKKKIRRRAITMFLALKQSFEGHKLKENLEVETIVAGWLMKKFMSYCQQRTENLISRYETHLTFDTKHEGN